MTAYKYHYKILPWNEDAGFPQKIAFKWKNVVLSVGYRTNSVDGSLIIEIRRKLDNKLMFSGKLNKGAPVIVSDPDTGIPWMTLVPMRLDQSDLKILIFDSDSYKEEL